MSMEDVIVQAINILSESMRESMREYKAEIPGGKELFSLTLTQLHYLHTIRTLGNPTITELAEAFGVQRSTVTVALNRLSQRNCIIKTPSSTDLRVIHVSLSAKGRELIEIEDEGYYRFASQITNVLDNKEREQFASLLGKVVKHIVR
jgi:DNA-binding MarR family transcriptional regulator